MKTSTKHHWGWPLGFIIFNICRLVPCRDKKLWVYGAWAGDKYDDNSKYFFEYVNAFHRNSVRSVWITNSPKTVETIRNKGYECYLSNSRQGLWLQIRAGVACYTNGLHDFGITPLLGGAEIVALWHGMGFKKIYNGKYRGYKLLLKKFLDRLFSWTYRNITPVTSKYAKKWVEEMFTLDKNKIFITGQPRNDAFKHVNRTDFFTKNGIATAKKLVLYMPTYRKPNLGSNAMQNIVKELYESKELSTYLDKTNSVFVAKLHPLTPHMDIENRDDFIILDNINTESTQELLGVADLLVTDYSSCFIDFALLERPIVFYVPDEEIFLTQSEKVEEEFFEIEKICMASTPSELSEKLLSAEKEVAKITNSIFEDNSIKGTCYSENVYNVVAKEIGI